MRLRTILSALVLAGCARAPLPKSPGPPPELRSPFTGYESPHYKDPASWLCLPGRFDTCGADLDATELHADGTRVVVRDVPLPGADDIDCFYVYPTVDMSLSPANHGDFADKEPMARATVAQAARFRNVCRLYVPLYRQVTIGTYLRSDAVREQYLAVAESDIVDAFLHYMGQWNAGHKVVLIGHSQGATMVARILRRYFDNDALMRDRLLVALPIGGDLEVAKGRTTGGTFSHIPVCTQPGETSCVVGFRSYVAGSDVTSGRDAPAPGDESICVNPAELVHGGPHLFTRAFIPVPPDLRSRMRGVENTMTPFVLLRDFYEGHCETREDGFRFLAVAPAPTLEDRRQSPVNFADRFFRGPLGLHILDLQFAQGDLLDLVARLGGERAPRQP